MARNPNTDVNGKQFVQTTLNAVWVKGRVIEGYDRAQWLYDMCGAPMKFSDYGNTDSKHGWEIDHICPVARGGSDEIGNLQPLQWNNNRRKGDTYPWNCD